MRRRRFLLALAALPAALDAAAQQKARTYRIGLILTTSPVSEMLGPEPLHPRIRALVHEFRRLGYMEGRNLILERRSAEGKFERFGAIVSELLQAKPDVLITIGGALTLVAAKLTNSVPIVMVAAADPVGAGVVPSLARPGGNVTGTSSTAGPELQAKRLQILKDAVPGASRIAYLGTVPEWESPHGQAARDAARGLGLSMFLAESGANDYSGAFARIERDRPHAVFVGGHFPHWVHRQVIVDFLVRNRLPSAHGYSESAELGGLMAYATFADDAWRRTAGYVDRILKGAKPGDLPIEQPTRFELVVNLKTAKAIGLAIPQSVLLRADRVIE